MANDRIARVWVGRLSSRVRERDLQDIFGRYGEIAKIDLKFGYAFIVHKLFAFIKFNLYFDCLSPVLGFLRRT
jgi:RNA recognition motif-containing protein